MTYADVMRVEYEPYDSFEADRYEWSEEDMKVLRKVERLRTIWWVLGHIVLPFVWGINGGIVAVLLES